jgi:hypothetical protein
MIPYSLHVAILLSVCLLFYKALLQRQTYYRLNRFLLLSCLVLSFALPLVSVPRDYSLEYLAPSEQNRQTIMRYVIKAERQESQTTILSAKRQNNTVDRATNRAADTSSLQSRLITWLWRIYWCGVVLMGANFLLQIVVLLYQYYKNPVIKDGRYRIVELDGDNAPCSFANYIFINPSKYDWDTYNQIILHEKIHIEQVHSLDLILAEIMLILQWFNPFAWYYRKTLENNLEFLTDDEVLQSPYIDKESYQMSLLKVSAPHFALSLTTNYNQSLLKKRIVMMGIKRSNLHTLWKYGMLIPVLAFMMCALNQPVAGNTVAPPPPTVRVQLPQSKSHLQPKTSSKKSPADSVKTVTIIHSHQNPVQLSQAIHVSPGDSSLTADTLFLLRAQEITPVFMREFQSIGLRVHRYTDWITLKKYNITASEAKQFIDLGFKQISVIDLSTLSDLKISPKYIKSFQSLGYQQAPLSQFYTFKVRGITPEYIKEFSQLGFSNISFQDLTSLKAVGLTPQFVAGMQQQGYHYKEIKKYIQLLPFKRKLMRDGTYQVLLPSDG